VGYADGLMRALSNCGYVLIHEQRLPIVGKISMDLTLVDATETTNVEVGDETVLIGKQGDQEIRVEELASLVQSIPYEILTRIGARVPRDRIWVRSPLSLLVVRAVGLVDFATRHSSPLVQTKAPSLLELLRRRVDGEVS
jgi:hypothetical protein